MSVSEVRRPTAGGEDVAFYTALYRRMLLIRRVEDLVQTLFLRGEVYGTTHLYSGQEAVAVGFEEHVLQPGDSISFASTIPHRLHNEGDEVARAIWVTLGRYESE